jgi:hypothetical protein
MKALRLRRYRGGMWGGVTRGAGYGSTIAFWVWEAVVRVGPVLGSCTGTDYESLIYIWRGYRQMLPVIRVHSI